MYSASGRECALKAIPHEYQAILGRSLSLQSPQGLFLTEACSFTETPMRLTSKLSCVFPDLMILQSLKSPKLFVHSCEILHRGLHVVKTLLAPTAFSRLSPEQRRHCWYLWRLGSSSLRTRVAFRMTKPFYFNWSLTPAGRLSFSWCFWTTLSQGEWIWRDNFHGCPPLNSPENRVEAHRLECMINIVPGRVSSYRAVRHDRKCLHFQWVAFIGVLGFLI